MNLASFHRWLQSALPSNGKTLLRELEIGRKAAPDAYMGLPTNAVELSEALRALEVAGRVRKDGTEWRWLAEPVKAEPQLTMF